MGFHMCKWYQCVMLHVADMNFWRYLDSDLIFDPCDPKWPQMKKWSNNICRVGQGDAHTWVTGPYCIILRTWCVFGKNNLFDPCDLEWPLNRSKVIWHMRARSLIIVTKFHWNRSKQLEDTLGYMVDRRRKKERKNHRKTEYRRIACACIRKKERKKEETSKKQDPAGVTGRVKKKEETSKKQDPAAAPAG